MRAVVRFDNRNVYRSMLDKPSSRSRTFVASRAAGLARLEAFAPSAGRVYAERRNSDFGPDDRHNVSVLSPYLRHRLIGEDEVLRAVLEQHSFASAEKFIQEVFWRTYFKGHLETRPIIWTNYQRDLAQQVALLERGGGFAKAYEQAVSGRTGIDCFDAWVSELQDTGYLHNHARMWFASIWIFTLKLPWQLGADLTYRHFIDGDAASNTLSWRWVGGLHTRGKTYLARPDNIAAHTGGRFSLKGLATEAVALEEPDLPAATRPRSAVDRLPPGRIALILTEDDLHPESMIASGADGTKIAATASVSLVDRRSLLPVGAPVRAFSEAAVADGLSRMASTSQGPAEALDDVSAQAFAAFAARHGVDTLVTPYAPIGPVRNALDEVEPALKALGVQLIRVRRPYDTLAWPHATRGFFAMKEKIPALLRELAIGL